MNTVIRKWNRFGRQITSHFQRKMEFIIKECMLIILLQLVYCRSGMHSIWSSSSSSRASDFSLAQLEKKVEKHNTESSQMWNIRCIDVKKWTSLKYGWKFIPRIRAILWRNIYSTAESGNSIAMTFKWKRSWFQICRYVTHPIAFISLFGCQNAPSSCSLSMTNMPEYLLHRNT